MAATIIPINKPMAIFFFNIAMSSPKPSPTIKANAGDLLIYGWLMDKFGLEIRLAKSLKAPGTPAGN